MRQKNNDKHQALKQYLYYIIREMRRREKKRKEREGRKMGWGNHVWI